jgi:hypothetical protein
MLAAAADQLLVVMLLIKVLVAQVEAVLVQIPLEAHQVELQIQEVAVAQVPLVRLVEVDQE